MIKIICEAVFYAYYPQVLQIESSKKKKRLRWHFIYCRRRCAVVLMVVTPDSADAKLPTCHGPGGSMRELRVFFARGIWRERLFLAICPPCTAPRAICRGPSSRVRRRRRHLVFATVECCVIMCKDVSACFSTIDV